MTRKITPCAQSPSNSNLIVDFTDGTHTLSAMGGSGDVNQDAGSGASMIPTRSYELQTGRGLYMSWGADGTTGKYIGMRYKPTTSIDLSVSNYFGVELEFPEGTSAVYNAVLVYLCSDIDVGAGDAFTNYYNRTISSGAIKVPNIVLMQSKISDMTKTLSPNLSAITKIELRISVHASAQNIAGWCWVRKFWSGAITS